MWEAVAVALKSCYPDVWTQEFPAPFFIFEVPILLWHDLSIILVVVCSAILAYLALLEK